MKHPESIQKLIAKFSSLPGVGAKTAARYAYSVIAMSADDAADFCAAITEVKAKIRMCKVCGNFCESDECGICSTRTHDLICVVAYPKDVAAIERTGFSGVYHVLHGTLSPLDGRGPEDIRIRELLSRLSGVTEVIVATNPDIEGEATAAYIARLLSGVGVKVTRLAQGVAMGSDIEYADEATLTRALSKRTEL